MIIALNSMVKGNGFNNFMFNSRRSPMTGPKAQQLSRISLQPHVHTSGRTHTHIQFYVDKLF